MFERGPFASVLEASAAEADQQQVEYVPGAAGSLWTFFKTVEFWRGDLLLTPVLILDQFEELFTLQPEQARELFLNELSYLVRGVRPPSAPDADRRSERRAAASAHRFVSCARTSLASSKKHRTTSRKSSITASA